MEQPALARATSAQTGELLEPLRLALISLDEAAAAVGDDAASWENWVAQLRRVFSCADVACQALARMLAARDELTQRSRWSWPGSR